MAFLTIPGATSVAATDAVDYLDGLHAAIVTPINQKGVSGWVFDIPLSESVSQSAAITKHVTESNSFVTDHITIMPDKITLSGLIGEIVYNPVSDEVRESQDLQDRLTVVTAFLPPLAAGLTQQAADLATDFAALSTASKAITLSNLVGNFSGTTQPKSKQQEAFEEISQLQKSRQIVTVDTPWGFYPSMAIESITATQSEETNELTEISITLTEMRFVEVETTAFDQNIFPVREEIQKSEEVDQGIIRGERDSFLFTAFGGGQ